MTVKPLVSIIVPTKNSSSTLRACIMSIKEQTYSNIELIVVDNYSTDATVKLASLMGVRVYSFGPERSAQMNFGVKKSRGDYIYRVDSDFVLEPHVVEEAVEKCEVEKLDAIAVHNTSDPSISFWSRVRQLERDCYVDDDSNIGARFFKKSVFLAVGGFDEELVAGEDYDLHNRLIKMGYKAGKIKSKEVHIGEPKSILEIAKKHYLYGASLEKYISKDSARGMQQLSPLRPAFLRHRKNFLGHPVLFTGFVVYQLVRYTASFFGIVMYRVRRFF